MDLVVRVPRMPRPGETVLGGEFGTFPGGKGANQAVAAGRLGAAVSMIGRVGDDDFGRRLTAGLQAEGVNIARVGIDPEAPSGIAVITLDEAGQNSIVVASGANMRMRPKDVAEALGSIGHIDAVVMPLEVPMDCIEAAVQVGKQRRALVVLNPAPARELPEELYSLIDVIVPNESETSILAGGEVSTLSQAEDAGRALQTMGVRKVVLTLGARGALVLDGDQPKTVLPAHKVEVVDTTAAGDAFVGALAVALAEGSELKEAARLANAAGALAVTRLGAQPSMPTRKDVEALLKSSGGEV